MSYIKEIFILRTTTWMDTIETAPHNPNDHTTKPPHTCWSSQVGERSIIRVRWRITETQLMYQIETGVLRIPGIDEDSQRGQDGYWDGWDGGNKAMSTVVVALNAERNWKNRRTTNDWPADTICWYVRSNLRHKGTFGHPIPPIKAWGIWAALLSQLQTTA